ncbi:MAG: HTH domain-containing protein [Candidatus Thorarchaeota archaeon]
MSEQTDDNLSSELLEGEAEISQFFEQIFSEFGINETLAKLLQFFALNDGAYLQRQLAQRLDVSVSTISRNLKSLERWGIITNKPVPGSRERLYSRTSDVFVEHFVYIVLTVFEYVSQIRERMEEFREEWYVRLSSETEEAQRAERIMEIMTSLIFWAEIFAEGLDEMISKFTLRSEEAKKRQKPFSPKKWKPGSERVLV